MLPEVSIVIVSFNTAKITCECLQSIIDQTHGVSYEIIVVDNGSVDASVADIRRLFPIVKLIESPKNLGFAAGQNLGMAHCSGAYVLILNSDIIILDDAVSRLARVLAEAPDRLAVVGPRVQQLDGSLAPSARRARLGTLMQVLGVLNRYSRFRRFLPEAWMRAVAGRFLGRFHDNYRSHDTREEADFVDGMCAMVRRSALEAVGLFDEQYFFDYEIVDLSNRIRAAGHSIEFIPEARVIHIGHVSRKNTSRILVETVRSELTYFAKFLPERFRMIQFLNLWLATWNLGYYRCVSLFVVRDVEKEVYRGIRQVCKGFDPVRALGQDRIPRLPAN